MSPLHPFGLISCQLGTGHNRYAGWAVDVMLDRLADGAPEPAGLHEYLTSDGVCEYVPAILASMKTHVWGACSVCGEGILVERPAVPQKPRAELKDSDGPLCRITWATETIENLTTTVRCRGRHYPLQGPWLPSHPLGAELVDELAW